MTPAQLETLRQQVLSMSGEEFHARMRTPDGRPARIIDAHSGDEIEVGGTFESPDGPATLVRLGDTIVLDDDVGVFGIYRIEATGEEKSVPMPYRYNHPGFPGEIILFIPS